MKYSYMLMPARTPFTISAAQFIHYSNFSLACVLSNCKRKMYNLFFVGNKTIIKKKEYMFIPLMTRELKLKYFVANDKLYD